MMALAAGTRLLDAQGRRILRLDGRQQISDGVKDGCGCGCEEETPCGECGDAPATLACNALGPCAACIVPGWPFSMTTPWNGILVRTVNNQPHGCIWNDDHSEPLSRHAELSFNTSLGVWVLYLTCNVPGGPLMVWKGTGPAVDCPQGVYNRTDGCDTTASVVIG